MADKSPSTKVKFVEDGSEKPALVKHVPTQKYNRKEIQKRLDIENWMDQKLSELFDSDVCVYNYVVCVCVCVCTCASRHGQCEMWFLLLVWSHMRSKVTHRPSPSGTK